jgi:hypothetical protein
MQAPALLLIAHLAAFRVQKRQQAQGGVVHPSLSTLEADWRAGIRGLLPTSVSAAYGRSIPFGDHHAGLWTWLWSPATGHPPSSFIGIWGRGGANYNVSMQFHSIGGRRSRPWRHLWAGKVASMKAAGGHGSGRSIGAHARFAAGSLRMLSRILPASVSGITGPPGGYNPPSLWPRSYGTLPPANSFAAWSCFGP